MEKEEGKWYLKMQVHGDEQFTDHCSGKVAFAPAVAAVFSNEK